MTWWIETARKVVPRQLRYAIQRYVSFSDIKLKYRAQSDPLSHVTESDKNPAKSAYRLGIIRNAAQFHTSFVKAAVEMELPFRVLDLFRDDWMEHVQQSGCNLLLAWPDGFLRGWNSMIKERIYILEHGLGYPVVPASHELWMYEDKRRMTYWLRANNIPHPKTWIFYKLDEALAFAGNCKFPIVFKTNFGASATGVRILKSPGDLESTIKQAFNRGIVPGGTDRRDREWGTVLLQEFLPEVKEWRMVRIGDSFFGHPKGRVGDFHSGSGVAQWDVPQDKHLQLLWEVTEKGKFRSMDVDMFETPDGRLFVNELQAVFGAGVSIDQLRVDGKAGRFVRTAQGSWLFEPGDFARNACANERIRDAIARGIRKIN